MTDIELIIKIPEEMYKNIQNRDWRKDDRKWFSEEWRAIRNGTILPKGKWIKDYDNSTLDGLYHCSVCGRKLWIPKEESVSDYPYCHCGAEMKGEQDVI